MDTIRVKYFSPSDYSIIYELDGKLILRDINGEEKPTSDYYPNSQHWNGNSPFFPVDYETTIDTLYDSDEIIHWLFFYYVKMFSDGINAEKNNLPMNDLKEIAIETIKEIINLYENGSLSKSLKEYNENQSNV